MSHRRDNNSELNEIATYSGLVEYVYQKAILLLEDVARANSMAMWVPTVTHPRLEKEFKSMKFIKLIVLEIMKEKGCVGPLKEVAKAMMSVDFTDMKARGRYLPLEAFLGHCLEYSKEGTQFTRFGSRRDQNDDPRVLVPELARFCMKQLCPRSGGGDKAEVLPPHMVDNIILMLLQVWQHMRADTMPPSDVPIMLESLRDTLKAWGTVPGGEGKQQFGAELSRGLNALHMLVKRALELVPAAAELPVYSQVRVMLLRLQRRVQVEEGQWTRLVMAPLHSPLPNPPLLDAPQAHSSLASMQGRGPFAVLPTSCSLLNLDGWVKCGPGRVRPWSAAYRPASPLGVQPTPMPTPGRSRGAGKLAGQGGTSPAMGVGQGAGAGDTIVKVLFPGGAEEGGRGGGAEHGGGGDGGGAAVAAAGPGPGPGPKNTLHTGRRAREARTNAPPHSLNTMRVEVGIQRIAALQQARIITRQREVQRKIAAMDLQTRRSWASGVIAVGFRNFLMLRHLSTVEAAPAGEGVSAVSQSRRRGRGEDAEGVNAKAAMALAQMRTAEMVADLRHMRRLALDEDEGAGGAAPRPGVAA